ncbi:MAG TPA: DMT family transporter [Pararobbsia sp.]|jgi:drug/metabolite transporter (DMT)-like permease|nr:DMT family transporter [Pararobbsia sp.]
MRGEHAKGNLIGIAGGLLISADALLIRLMRIDDGWTLAALRGALMWVVLATLYVCVPRLRALLGRPWPTRNNAIVVVCYSVSAIGFVQALLLGPVAMVLVIIASTPFMAALFAWLVNGERAPWPLLVAIAIGMLGVAIVVFSGAEGNSWAADLYALATAVSMALALVFSARVRGGTMGLPSIGGALASIIVCVVHPSVLTALHTLGHSAWLWLFVEGAIVMPVSMGLLSLSTRFVPASVVGLFLLLETAFGPLWIWFAYGEAPSLSALIGGALIIGAVIGHFVCDSQRGPARADAAADSPNAC